VFTQSGELAALTISLTLVAAVHVAIGLVIRGFVGWFATGQAGDRPQPVLVSVSVPVAPAAPRDVIFVKTEQRLEKIRLDEILLIEGQRDYRRIHTPSRRIMTLQTFAEFERQLPADVVCRVHKSYMVAVGQIDSIERGRITIGSLTIPISDTYRDRFFALIGQR
jgi:DNA-binding LytR/AlgR family response regulator